MRDLLALFRLGDIDLVCLLLVCGKQHVLLMLIILTMALVIGQMQLDHNAHSREHKDRRAVHEETESHFRVGVSEASQCECPRSHNGSANYRCELNNRLFVVKTSCDSDTEAYDDVDSHHAED